MNQFSLYQFIDQALKISEELGALETKIHQDLKSHNESKALVERSKDELLALKRESLEIKHKIEEKEFDIDEFFDRENKEKVFIDQHMSSHVRVLAQKSLQAIQAERLEAEKELASLYAQQEKTAPKFQQSLERKSREIEILEKQLLEENNSLEKLKSKQNQLVEELKTLAKNVPEDVFKKIFHNGDLKKLTLAKVVSQLCSKCFYPVSSLQYNTLMRKETDLIECKNCFISLYINKSATV